MFQFRREQCHRIIGFRPPLPMPPAVAAVAMHPRRVHGWDAESANFGSFSFLSRSLAATIALIGADTPRSFSRREGTIESLVPVGPGDFDVALSGNHASTGMLAERNSGCFRMLAHPLPVLIRRGIFIPCRTFA